ILRRHGALISGSTALHFLMPSDTWIPNDLDIYVSDTNFPGLLRDLMDPSGLQLVYASDSSGSGTMSPLPPAAIAKGLRDVRTLYTPSGRRVDVIRSPSTSPITPLRFFWSTTVINFMTPDAYVCGFPHATLSRLGVLK
ncbi:hypothetical protein OH76DRAFT_1307484, partial [Lentinus brumalis]